MEFSLFPYGYPTVDIFISSHFSKLPHLSPKVAKHYYWKPHRVQTVPNLWLFNLNFLILWLFILWLFMIVSVKLPPENFFLYPCFEKGDWFSFSNQIQRWLSLKSLPLRPDTLHRHETHLLIKQNHLRKHLS